MKALWQKFEISTEQTHHIIDQEPAYPARFHSVLKFHEPGIAPVLDSSGAFHINALGEPLYSDRFLRTFGFYENRAAVQSSSGWYHIFTNGIAVYQNRYDWCGNFQQGHCAVKDGSGAFFHIDQEGRKAYPKSFQYVGDFRDGYAVVQNDGGLHTHIDFEGNLLHGKWFIDLDVYHKGFARAKSQQGWFHIDLQGLAIYLQRYKSIEPFYNGVARVETKLGALLLIKENGEKLETLREPLEDEFHQVSADLVSYWRFYTLQSANELQLFDHFPNTAPELSELIDLPPTTTLKLLRALQEMEYVSVADDGTWFCTTKGAFFQSNHPYTLKHASTLWREEHLTSWSQLTFSLRTGTPAFDQIFGKGWFEWLKDHPDKNELYHSAIFIYAQRDYHAFCNSIDLSKHRSLVDVGGSTGALLINVLNQNPNLKGLLLDLPNVIELVKLPSHLKERVQCISADFFETWPSFAVESAILSRILHDWPLAQALKILQNVHSVLSDNPNNRLYIIEKVQEETSPHGALLDLNMLVMTGGVERTLEDFKLLLGKAGFILEKTLPLNEVSSILVAKKEPT